MKIPKPLIDFVTKEGTRILINEGGKVGKEVVKKTIKYISEKLVKKPAWNL